jgi:hypothetical protein
MQQYLLPWLNLAKHAETETLCSTVVWEVCIKLLWL